MHFLVFWLWLAICAAQDLRQRKIANILTLGAGLLAGLYLLWTGHTWLGAAPAEGGWALLLALLLTLPGYAMGKMGAGDVKLMAALGLASDLQYLLGSFIGAGLCSLLWLLLSRLGSQVKQALGPPGKAAGNIPSKKYPFAPFVLAGMVLTVMVAH
ncbi:MAG: prepilin peptidase [Pseudomonas sp.]|uniref:prepilin peptidase n=1 Tax=unclassified Pseudomonas TaxID=196821 RepID=UPI0007311F98|nr:prepilin peptidase [Pseudomonas sp. L5B5]KTC29870.1 peptidase A24 [Pseudomonas sp. ABAC61]UCZ81819.1 prepilin peptidase [Pseudomonas sp. L5B5]